MNTCCVIGVGCDDHGDQIAGLLVARAVAERSNGAIAGIESSGSPQHLVRSWSGCDDIVIVEAMPGDRPGTLHYRYPHPRARAVIEPPGRLSARLREALALGPLPDQVTVITIEAECFVRNAPVTGVVERAASEVAARLCAHLNTPALVPTPRVAVASRAPTALVGA